MPPELLRESSCRGLGSSTPARIPCATSSGYRVWMLLVDLDRVGAGPTALGPIAGIRRPRPTC